MGTVLDRLVCAAPLSETVQRHILDNYPRLHGPLESNPYLTPELWLKLATTKRNEDDIARLVWRRDMTADRIRLVFIDQAEERIWPLRAAVAACPRELEAVLPEIAHRLRPAAADLILHQYHQLRPKAQLLAVPRGSWHSASTFAMRDISALDQAEVVTALSSCAAASRAWSSSGLDAACASRPEFAAACVDGHQILASSAAHGYLDPEHQARLLARWRGWSNQVVIAQAEVLWWMPSTTPKSRATIVRRAKRTKHPVLLSLIKKEHPPYTPDLADTSVETVNFLFKQVAVPQLGYDVTWPLLVTLANMTLTDAQNKKAIKLLKSRKMSKRLGNKAKYAARYFEGSTTQLLPAYNWVPHGSHADPGDLVEKRYGPAVRATARASERDPEYYYLSQLANRNESVLGLCAYIAEGLGDDLAAWDAAIALADDFSGKVADFPMTIRLLAA